MNSVTAGYNNAWLQGNNNTNYSQQNRPVYQQAFQAPYGNQQYGNMGVQYQPQAFPQFVLPFNPQGNQPLFTYNGGQPYGNMGGQHSFQPLQQWNPPAQGSYFQTPYQQSTFKLADPSVTGGINTEKMPTSFRDDTDAEANVKTETAPPPPTKSTGKTALADRTAVIESNLEGLDPNSFEAKRLNNALTVMKQFDTPDFPALTTDNPIAERRLQLANTLVALNKKLKEIGENAPEAKALKERAIALADTYLQLPIPPDVLKTMNSDAIVDQDRGMKIAGHTRELINNPSLEIQERLARENTIKRTGDLLNDSKKTDDLDFTNVGGGIKRDDRLSNAIFSKLRVLGNNTGDPSLSPKETKDIKNDITSLSNLGGSSIKIANMKAINDIDAKLKTLDANSDEAKLLKVSKETFIRTWETMDADALLNPDTKKLFELAESKPELKEKLLALRADSKDTNDFETKFKALQKDYATDVKDVKLADKTKTKPTDQQVQLDYIMKSRAELANTTGTILDLAKKLNPESPTSQKLQTRIAELQELDRKLEAQYNSIALTGKAATTIDAKTAAKTLMGNFTAFAKARKDNVSTFDELVAYTKQADADPKVKAAAQYFIDNKTEAFNKMEGGNDKGRADGIFSWDELNKYEQSLPTSVTKVDTPKADLKTLSAESTAQAAKTLLDNFSTVTIHPGIKQLDLGQLKAYANQTGADKDVKAAAQYFIDNETAVFDKADGMNKKDGIIGINDLTKFEEEAKKLNGDSSDLKNMNTEIAARVLKENFGTLNSLGGTGDISYNQLVAFTGKTELAEKPLLKAAIQWFVDHKAEAYDAAESIGGNKDSMMSLTDIRNFEQNLKDKK